MERTTDAKDGMMSSPELRRTHMADFNQRREGSSLAQRYHPESVERNERSYDDLGSRVLASMNQMIDDAQNRSLATFPSHTHTATLVSTQAVGQTKQPLYVSGVRTAWKHRLSA